MSDYKITLQYKEMPPVVFDASQVEQTNLGGIVVTFLRGKDSSGRTITIQITKSA